MLKLPSAELLETQHTFPCVYTFKVIGQSGNEFSNRVVAEVREELKLDEDPPFSVRETKNGQHISITLEPMCSSVEQVLAVYARLSALDQLVMLL